MGNPVGRKKSSSSEVEIIDPPKDEVSAAKQAELLRGFNRAPDGIPCSLCTFYGLRNVETLAEAKILPKLVAQRSDYYTFLLVFVSTATGWGANTNKKPHYSGNGPEKIKLFLEAGYKEQFRYPAGHDPKGEVVVLGIKVREAGSGEEEDEDED